MPLMLVCFSRFIVDLTFVLLKRNLSLHLNPLLKKMKKRISTPI